MRNIEHIELSDLEALIVDENYRHVPGTTMTICVLTLANGFHVIGESACLDEAAFDAEEGEIIARANAVEKLWPLEGYRRKWLIEEPPSAVTEAMIARVAHEVNRAYCLSIGDTSQPAWADAPEWQVESAINGVRFHLAQDRDPRESHENWLVQKVADGWTYGPLKDPINKKHPCMVPYDELPTEQRATDALFKAVVDSFKAGADLIRHGEGPA